MESASSPGTGIIPGFPLDGFGIQTGLLGLKQKSGIGFWSVGAVRGGVRRSVAGGARSTRAGRAALTAAARAPIRAILITCAAFLFASDESKRCAEDYD